MLSNFNILYKFLKKILTIKKLYHIMKKSRSCFCSSLKENLTKGELFKMSKLLNQTVYNTKYHANGFSFAIIY